MNKLTDIPPLTQTDKLCLTLLALCFLISHLAVWAMDAAAERAVEADKPPTEVAIATPPIDCTPLVAAVESALKDAREAAQADPYDEAIPLDRECQEALWDACEEHGVSVPLALGVIHEESRFDPDADNGLCYGYMGLNKNYYPDDLTSVENIWEGVSHLAGQIERYGGDIPAALRGYNKGWDDGDRRYAKAVLSEAEKWEVN